MTKPTPSNTTGQSAYLARSARDRTRTTTNQSNDSEFCWRGPSGVKAQTSRYPTTGVYRHRSERRRALSKTPKWF